MFFECDVCKNGSTSFLESIELDELKAVSSSTPLHKKEKDANTKKKRVDACSKLPHEPKERKRGPPKTQHDGDLLFTNRKAKRCQNCHRHFTVSPPGNFMVAKYTSFKVPTARGIKNSERNYYFCVEEKCLQAVFGKNFTMNDIHVNDDIKGKLTVANAQWLQTQGLDI